MMMMKMKSEGRKEVSGVSSTVQYITEYSIRTWQRRECSE
jgi:hypothetical protein